ncbi:MAG: hypothetical protein RL095_265 [Verrucomicrobiota bacterium]|jgi:hypothetical protein
MSGLSTALGMTTKALSVAFDLVREVQLRQVTESMLKYEVSPIEVTDATASRFIILYQATMAAQCKEKMDMLMALYWGHQKPELSDFDLYEEQMRVVGDLSRLEIILLVHLDKFHECHSWPKENDEAGMLNFMRTYYAEAAKLAKRAPSGLPDLFVRLNRTGLIIFSNTGYGNLPGVTEEENEYFRFPPIPSKAYLQIKSHINDKFYAEYSAKVVV